jgi:hypothetical protein
VDTRRIVELSPRPIASPRIAYLRRHLARSLERGAAAVIGIPFLVFLALELGSSLTPKEEALAGDVLGLGAVMAILLGTLAFVLNRSLFATSGVIRCERNDLLIERRSCRTIPITDIEAGFVVPTRNATNVELHLKGGDVIDAQVESAAAATALLRAARVDVARQRCRIQLVDQNARLFVGLAVAGGLAYASMPALGFIAVALPGLAGVLVWACVLALTALVAVRATALPEVTIGTDGISFKRGFFETFVPFEELAEIRPAGLGILIRYRNGRTRTIFSPAGVGPERFEALLLRIREAMAARAQGSQPELEVLDRRGRSISEWRAALTDLARRGATYRNVGLSLEEIEAVISSPDATPERRLAAAVALRAAEHPAAASLIRIAAAQCASQRLRVGLESVGSGEDDNAALAEALGESLVPPVEKLNFHA